MMNTPCLSLELHCLPVGPAHWAAAAPASSQPWRQLSQVTLVVAASHQLVFVVGGPYTLWGSVPGEEMRRWLMGSVHVCMCLCAVQLHQKWDLRRFFSVSISTLSDSLVSYS